MIKVTKTVVCDTLFSGLWNFCSETRHFYHDLEVCALHSPCANEAIVFPKTWKQFTIELQSCKVLFSPPFGPLVTNFAWIFCFFNSEIILRWPKIPQWNYCKELHDDFSLSARNARWNREMAVESVLNFVNLVQ